MTPERMRAWAEALRDESAEGKDFELAAKSGLEIAASLERAAEVEEQLASAQQRLQIVDRWIEHCRGRHDAAIADCLVDWLDEPETVDELAGGSEHE